MDCDRARRDDLIERYLAGELSHAEQDALEEHYFACDLCLERLENVRAAQEALASSADQIEAQLSGHRHRRWWVIASGIAAALAIAVASALLLRPSSGPPARLLAMARIEAPAYTPVQLRGFTDQAQQLFRSGMRSYEAGDYASAIPDLQKAAHLDYNAADVSFYLGASYLLTGRNPEGLAELEHTVDLGDTPYLEEALLLSAKAHIAIGDLSNATIELHRVVELSGDSYDQALAMLELLDGERAR